MNFDRAEARRRYKKLSKTLKRKWASATEQEIINHRIKCANAWKTDMRRNSSKAMLNTWRKRRGETL